VRMGYAVEIRNVWASAGCHGPWEQCQELTRLRKTFFMTPIVQPHWLGRDWVNFAIEAKVH
jgi:hypothetical protein